MKTGAFGDIVSIVSVWVAGSESLSALSVAITEIELVPFVFNDKVPLSGVAVFKLTDQLPPVAVVVYLALFGTVNVIVESASAVPVIVGVLSFVVVLEVIEGAFGAVESLRNVIKCVVFVEVASESKSFTDNL